ncbi:MAG: DUF349 domain-containing protein [Candidatus Marisimplicoccus sp.]
MKDSNKKSIKSSSDSENPVKKIIPKMPKDKRTKAYKEWLLKYGDQKSESNDIPEMPSDKRTKAYKEWMKQYGDQTLNEKKESKKSISKVKRSGKINLSDLIDSYIDYTNLNDWFQKRKEIEDLRSKINLLLKTSDPDSVENRKLKSSFFQTLKNFSNKKRKYFNDLSSNQKENLLKRQELIEKIKELNFS